MAVTQNAQATGTSGSSGGGGGSGGTVNIDTSVLAKTTQLPASLGAKVAAQALPVTLSPDGALVTAIGTQADAAATDSASAWSVSAILKGILAFLKGGLSNITATATLTALNAKVGVTVGPQATVGAQVSGTGTAFVLQPQASMDGGTTWINVSVIAAGAGATSAPLSTLTANGNYEFNAGGYTNFQLATTTAAATGAVTGTLVATPAQKFVRSAGIGDQSDAAATSGTGSASVVSAIKGVLNYIKGAFTNSTATADITALNALCSIAVGALGAVGVQLTNTGTLGAFVIQPQASMDGGVTWVFVPVLNIAPTGSGQTQTSITSVGNFLFNAAGYTHFRLLTTTAQASGTITALLNATPANNLLLPQTAVNGTKALAVAIQSQMAGERNVNSLTNSYLTTRAETNGTIVTGVATAVMVSAQPAHLQRAMPVNAALVGTATITGLTDQSGNAVSVVIPVGTAAFTPIDFSWARCETNLQVTLSNAADKLLLNWRPI